MKAIFLVIFSSFIFFNFGCSHGVYRTEIPSEHMNLINDDVTGRCEEKCEVDTCWLETKTLTVCSVQFSALDTITQKRVLTTSVNALKEKGLVVGFCGHDKSVAKNTGSSFRSTGSSAFAGASGGAGAPFAAGTTSSSLANQVYPALSNADDEAIMKQACHSTPMDN